MKARFTIKFSWNTHVPPFGFTSAGTLIGEGQGGVAGFARGEAQGPDAGGVAANQIPGGRAAY